MAIVYRSKVDRWFMVVMTVALTGSLIAAIAIALSGSWTALMQAGFIIFICAGFPLWLLLATSYTLTAGHLAIKCGPFKWRIQLADITSITPTSNPLSSPALSLDRLRIEYGKGSSLMISPCNKQQFIEDIEAARRCAAAKM